MSKHTEGPWEWIGANQLWGGKSAMEEVLKADDDGKAYGLHSALIEHHWDGEVASANRRLIAAAPELLPALQVIAADSRWLSGEPALVMARAAIAKATGEQQ